MQTIPSPILPPLIYFLLPRKMLGDWNTAFDFDRVFKNDNHRNVLQLLLDFFAFYHNFNFANIIFISPLFGQTYISMQLRSVPEQSTYHRFVYQYPNDTLWPNRSIIVYDPFLLNILALCKKDLFPVFRTHLRTMVEHVHVHSHKNSQRVCVDVLRPLFAMRANLTPPNVKEKPSIVKNFHTQSNQEETGSQTDPVDRYAKTFVFWCVTIFIVAYIVKVIN